MTKRRALTYLASSAVGLVIIASVGLTMAGDVREFQWLVPFAERFNGVVRADFCGTSVVITNPTQSDVSVTIDWRDVNDVPVASDAFSVPSGRRLASCTNDQILGAPDCNRALGLGPATEFNGFANVFASSRRADVSAFYFCRSGLGDAPLLAITHLPVLKVKD